MEAGQGLPTSSYLLHQPTYYYSIQSPWLSTDVSPILSKLTSDVATRQNLRLASTTICHSLKIPSNFLASKLSPSSGTSYIDEWFRLVYAARTSRNPTASRNTARPVVATLLFHFNTCCLIDNIWPTVQRSYNPVFQSPSLPASDPSSVGPIVLYRHLYCSSGRSSPIAKSMSP